MSRIQNAAPVAPQPDNDPIPSLADRARLAATVAAAQGSVPRSVVAGTALALDAAALVGAGFVSVLWANIGMTGGEIVALLAAPFPILVAARWFGAYRTSAIRDFAPGLAGIAAAWLGVLAVIAAAAFALNSGGLSRGRLVAWLFFGSAALVLARGGYALLVRRWAAAGRLRRRAVIVGGGPAAEELIAAIGKDGNDELQIFGIFDDRADSRSPESVAGHPKLGTVSELVEFGRIAGVDLLIVSIPLSAESRLLQMLSKLWILPVDIRLSAHSSKLKLRPRSYSYIGGVPFLDAFDRPISGWDGIAKRIFDVVFASLMLIGFSPVMLATAIAIKLDTPGPVLFRQKRYGFNNEVINVLKFRSLRHEMADPLARTQVTKNDSRVTRVGRFIRRTSIDELPQIVNVLRGELSLVGPRPHAVTGHLANTLYEEAIEGYFARHKVKPGVTGWAQVNGWRGETDTAEKIEQRVAHDLYYIENWSVFFDLYIMIITPFRMLKQSTAY
jgi:Undecaprenyl-phosphate glucose phosphotransferase